MYIAAVFCPYLIEKYLIPYYRARMQSGLNEEAKIDKSTTPNKIAWNNFKKFFRMLLPEAFSTIMDWMKHSHFAVFLIFGQYNDISKRLIGLRYFKIDAQK